MEIGDINQLKNNTDYIRSNGLIWGGTTNKFVVVSLMFYRDRCCKGNSSMINGGLNLQHSKVILNLVGSDYTTWLTYILNKLCDNAMCLVYVHFMV